MARISIDNGSQQLSAEHSGNPAGPAVLFLHGITSSADTWLESAQRLADRFDCWALDFRSHGCSERSTTPPTLTDYAADSAAALQQIGRPTIVVGHSLGGITAAHLAHEAHPLVKAVFLEDPPLFLIDPVVLASTLYPKMFTMLRDAVAKLQAADEPFEVYVDFARNLPSPMGGVAGDHTTERQVLCRARQNQQFDPLVLDSAIDGGVFSGLNPHRPMSCPVTLLAANEAYGAAFLSGDAERLLAHSPHAEVLDFAEVGHSIHMSKVSEARFLAELDRFVTAHA